MKYKEFPLEPLDDQIVILPDETPGQSKGGIVLPDSAQERATTGLVVAVGPGRLMVGHAGGFYHPLIVKVGDKVLFPRYTGKQIEVAGRDHMIIREHEILAVYKP